MSAPKGLGGSGLSGGNLPPALQQQLAALAGQSGGQTDPAKLLASLRGSGLGALVEGQLQNLIGRPSGFIEELPTKIQGRIEYLQQLQDKHSDLEEQFQDELAALRAKYQTLYEPLYAKRAAVVTGAEEPPVTATAEELSTEQDDQADVPAGIPDFWLNVLRANPITQSKLSEKDEEILKFLDDISAGPLTPYSPQKPADPDAPDGMVPDQTATDEEKPTGFKIIFTFRENPFFSNTTLTKSYHMVEEEEPVLEKAEGTVIQWKQGKDPTKKLVRKKSKGRGGKGGQTITKSEDVDSFFSFFSPPAVPAEEPEDEEAMATLQALMEEDYEIGDIIRSRLVPKAVSWYTGEEAEDDSDEEYGDDEDEDEDADEDDDGDDDEDEEAEKDEEGVELIKPSSKSNAKAAKGQAAGEQPPECKQQ